MGAMIAFLKRQLTSAAQWAAGTDAAEQAAPRDRRLLVSVLLAMVVLYSSGLALEALFGLVGEIVGALFAGHEQAYRTFKLFAFTVVVVSFSVLLFVSFVSAAQTYRPFISSSRNVLKKGEEVPPHPAIVVTLSHPEDPGSDEGQLLAVIKKARDNFSDLKARLESTKKNDATLRPYKWQQTIRAIDHHVDYQNNPPCLPRIYVLTSLESEAGKYEDDDFTRIKRLLVQLYALSIESKISKLGPVDFEDYDSVWNLLKPTLAKLEREHGGTGTVAVDITGGQRPLVAAVTVLTLDSVERKFSYVRETGEVKFYNTEAEMTKPASAT